MNRAEVARLLTDAVKQQFGPDARLGPINWGDGHRTMLLWNRRFERAYARSVRNQPPKARR